RRAEIGDARAHRLAEAHLMPLTDAVGAHAEQRGTGVRAGDVGVLAELGGNGELGAVAVEKDVDRRSRRKLPDDGPEIAVVADLDALDGKDDVVALNAGGSGGAVGGHGTD